MVSRASSAVAAIAIATLAACNHRILVPHTLERTAPPAHAELVALRQTFKLVAWNVHGRSARELLRVFTEDPVLSGADLLVIAEAKSNGPCSEVCLMARELGMYAVYAPGVGLGPTEGLAIVARVRLEDARTFELPKIPMMAHNEHSFVLAARVRVADRYVTVYAVHLSLRLSIDERRRQMRPALEDARDQPTPVIIAGDVNTNRFGWIGHEVPFLWRSQTGPFEQFIRSFGFETPVTGSGKTFRLFPIRIDGIYTRGFITDAYGKSQGMAISDHLALWAVVTLRPS